MNVFELIKSKNPQVHVEEAAVANAKEVTTAALNNDDPLVCPVCKQKTVLCKGGNDVPMLVCMAHRVAMPVPNGVLQ